MSAPREQVVAHAQGAVLCELAVGGVAAACIAIAHDVHTQRQPSFKPLAEVVELVRQARLDRRTAFVEGGRAGDLH